MSTSLNPREERIAEFVSALKRLDAGGRARLRRNAGRSLAQARDAQRVFFQLLPYGVREFDEDKYFLLATLFALSRQETSGKGTFGAALRRLRDPKRSDSLDRRFQALLACDSDQLPFRLRQMVRLAVSQNVPIDWEQMLKDLLLWNAPEKWVQLKWARDYFIGKQAETPS